MSVRLVCYPRNGSRSHRFGQCSPQAPSQLSSEMRLNGDRVRRRSLCGRSSRASTTIQPTPALNTAPQITRLPGPDRKPDHSMCVYSIEATQPTSTPSAQSSSPEWPTTLPALLRLLGIERASAQHHRRVLAQWLELHTPALELRLSLRANGYGWLLPPPEQPRPPLSRQTATGAG
jgi:hypothetical protein